MKTLYLVISSSFFDQTCQHIRTGSLPLGNKDEDKCDNRRILLIILSSKLPVRLWWEVLKTSINYQIQGFSLQLKNGWSEVLELVALFLFKTGTRGSDAKNAWQFFVEAIGGFHVTSSTPCWWTVNKRSLISSLCLSTSICSFHHCYLCLPRLHENHLYLALLRFVPKREGQMQSKFDEHKFFNITAHSA